jgi:bifunctional enzyme CysN/CysC
MPRSTTVWLTGLSGSGKTTSAFALRDHLTAQGRSVVVFDGDDLRGGLSIGLGFSDADRDENVRRAGEVALLLAEQVDVVIVALISPRASARRTVRARHDDLGVPFLEVYIATPLSVCESRDPKNLYREARSGTRTQMTGVTSPYDVPESADITVSTETLSPNYIAAWISASL